MAASHAERVLVPPNRFISTPLQEILEAEQERLGKEEHQLFAAFTRLVEGTSQFEFQEARRRIKHNFQLFLVAGGGNTLPARRGKAPPTDSELDEREQRFLADFVALLTAAHYRPLSQAEWESALAEAFTFTLPVEVKWDRIDRALLARFWATHPQAAAGAQLADICDRAAVFHRGITTATATGVYLDEKVDLLVGYLLVAPASRLASALFGERAKAAVIKRAPMVAEENKVPKDEDFTGGAGAACTALPGPAAPRVVERVTLAHAMPTAGAVLRNLFTPITLQEPSFKDMVVVYRRAVPPPPPPPAAGAKAAAGSSAAQPGAGGGHRVQRVARHAVAAATSEVSRDGVQGEAGGAASATSQRLAQRNITIKSFGDVPMADMEMIFPDKRLYLKPVVLLQLTVTLLAGIFAGLSMLFGTEISTWLMISALGVLLTRAGTVYMSAQTQKQLLTDEMHKRLYEKSLDAQAGVVYTLLDEMADQHIKEVVLAYTTLLYNGKPMTAGALDAACERRLEAEFGERLDFAIERSLPRCLADGLIRRDAATGGLTAVPLAEAVRLLDAKWDQYFQLAEDGKLVVPGASAITSSAPSQRGPVGGAVSAVGKAGRGLAGAVHSAGSTLLHRPASAARAADGPQGTAASTPAAPGPPPAFEAAVPPAPAPAAGGSPASLAASPVRPPPVEMREVRAQLSPAGKKAGGHGLLKRIFGGKTE